MMKSIWLASLVLVVGSACAADPRQQRQTSAPSVTTPSGSEGGSSELYEANAEVLEDGKSGPKLCLGVIQTSLPPQCGEVPVVGWDWADVEGEESVGGVTWGGAYHVVGTFDGTTFVLADEPGPPAAHLEPADDFSSAPACEEPPGGWVTEGDGIDQQAAGRILGLLESDPDYAAGWVTQLAPAGSETDTGPVVLNAAFTDHVVEHERRLREQWSGSLCVTLYEHSLKELQRIQREAGELAQEMGSQNLYSDIDVTRNAVELHVVHLPDHTREELERRFGPDVLRLSAALVPVDDGT